MKENSGGRVFENGPQEAGTDIPLDTGGKADVREAGRPRVNHHENGREHQVSLV